MPFSFLETQNRASPDYPYILKEKENLSCHSHFHEDIEITEVISGELTVVQDGHKLLLRQGDICIIMPEEIHSYLSLTPNKIHVMKIHYQHSEEQLDLSRLRLSRSISNSDPLGKRICLITKEIRSEDDTRRIGYGYAVNRLCATILQELLRSDLCQPRETREQKKHAVSLTVLETVNDYIRAHYTEPISLETIALACGLSPYYFAHLFKESTGTTFFHYLTVYRCDKATTLLTSERRSMIDVALTCGFSDVRAFNRAFKRIYGQTPSEYRRQIR